LQVQQHVEVLLADGVSRIKVALTEQSADRLQLSAGKEVLILIKAPWVELTRASSEADNQLACTISDIERAPHQSEVLLSLASGETLCATVPAQLMEQQNFQPGDCVTACFNADRVIIATLL